MSNAFDLTVKALREQGMNSDEILNKLSELFQKLAETNNKTATAKTTEQKIRKLLIRIGVPINTKGYDCWMQAILIYKKSGKMYMKEIYYEVGKICEIPSRKVDRAMRYASECALQRCPQQYIEEVFREKAHNNKKKLTNTEFLSILAEQIGSGWHSEIRGAIVFLLLNLDIMRKT